MNILHLTLGIPKLRTGGLISYSYSVAESETKLGHNVVLLYPGNLGLIRHKSKIKKTRYSNQICIYKLKNAAFVPIPLGIENPDLIMKNIDPSVYRKFLDEIKPDLVHVHTFMGFTKELFIEIKRRNIPIVYTTHDYYAICPKTSLINEKKENCSGCDAKKCALCNIDFHKSKLVQYVLQSEWYPLIKRNKLIINLKKKRKRFIKESPDKVLMYDSDLVLDSNKVKRFKEFLEYQITMLKCIDLFHCNSSVTNEIYLKALPNMKHFTLNITTQGIVDNRKENFERPYKNNNYITVGFIGIRDYHKGYWILRDAVQILYQKNYKIKAVFYGDEFNIDNSKYKLCEEKGTFEHSKLSEIMKTIDMLVIPGYWYETFGFSSIEAIANNVPVLLSTHTGSKDVLIDVKTPHLFEPFPNRLADLLEKYINNVELIENAIEEQEKIELICSMENHVKKFLQKVEENLLK